MDYFRILSGTEQVAAYLKKAILQGRWTQTLPGGAKLAVELGVNAKTIDGALRILEKEGVLVSQGRRKKRMIAEQGSPQRAPLRIAIIGYDAVSEMDGYYFEVQRRLIESGYSAFFTDKSLTEMQLDLRKVVKLVNKTPADAWIVVSGSREILEWFSEQQFPTFALFGRRGGLPLAGIGPDQPHAVRVVVRRLIELGHQNIVFITNSSRVLPVPGSTERAFLSELEKYGKKTSRFNLPLWEETIDGLYHSVEEMMRYTPPTAIIVNDKAVFSAVHHCLLLKRYRIPEDISIVCSDADPSFKWLRPAIAHVGWSSIPWVRRIGRWADNVSQGKQDQRQSLSKVKFIEGGTIGTAPIAPNNR